MTSKSKGSRWFVIDTKRPWKVPVETIAEAHSKNVAWIVHDGHRRFIGISVFREIDKAHAVRYFLIRKKLSQIARVSFKAKKDVKAACMKGLESFDRKFLTSVSDFDRIEELKIFGKHRMKIQTKNMTWHPKTRNFTFKHETFPLFIEVVSSKTGTTIQFVQDSERALNNDFWDGELMVYVPTASNVDCTVTLYRG